ncbi:hypothetical protein ATPR_0180 [Acetobacter tropicalis NBRC 101654]|uniref:Uncharacterized protein n=1 Tax=Acetobacter tropicalis NBRC 101654 TaxID=749388 RepID=F7V9Y1_9PROT|nr:hypothetical protein ATPR_0180 [Acetobacter tropicalis NBRC 101654]
MEDRQASAVPQDHHDRLSSSPIFLCSYKLYRPLQVIFLFHSHFLCWSYSILRARIGSGVITVGRAKEKS